MGGKAASGSQRIEDNGFHLPQSWIGFSEDDNKAIVKRASCCVFDASYRPDGGGCSGETTS